MSNNSWKQYGGVSDLDNFNFINANTIIADQFVSRSTKPTYQYFNGTFEVSQDLSAGVNILAGNSIYSDVDLYVNRNIYSNNKIFFGGNALVNTGNVFPERPDDTTAAFLYGDVSYVGVNILKPKTIFNITSTVSGETDILTVENKNDYIRNIIAQNQEQRGLVVDACNNEANIYFYVDSSTNIDLSSNANIKYNIGGYLLTTTTNNITHSSRENKIDTSGGTVVMNGDKLQTDSSVNIIMNGAKTYHLDISDNIIIDTSAQYILHSSGGYFILNDSETSLTTDGSLIIQSLNTSSPGYVELNSTETTFNTLLNVTPFGRGVSGELYEETLTVYDNSNSQFLKNVYDNSGITTGNAVVGVGKDPSANTFMRLVPATSLQGSAYGGGLYPYDTSRSMNIVGVNDSSGELITNQMIVESSNKHKYTSTLGINTFMPRTEEYVVDMNGPLRVANGEINTVAVEKFEFLSVSFAKGHPNCGIAVGTPSSLVESDFGQIIIYTKDGGKTWNKSQVYSDDNTLADNLISFTCVHLYDDSYGIIGRDIKDNFITADGG